MRDYEFLFNRNLKLLENYKKEHGDCLVPIDYVVDGVRLGLWIYNLRKGKKNNIGRNLSEERIKLLEDLGMIWSYRENQWKLRIELLKEYKDEYGDCNVPVDYEVDGIRLGAWVQTVRIARKSIKNGDKSRGTLTNKQINELDSLGFKWDYFEELWQEKFKQYVKYINGEEVENPNSIKDWANAQRSYKKNDLLSDDRVKQLESIGFVFDPYKEIFDARLESLKKFYKENGHCDVPRNYVVDGVKLGNWVDGIRTARKGNGNYSLSDEQIKELDKVHMIWDLYEYNWNKNYLACKEYKEETGSLKMSNYFVYKDLNIYSWLQTQRALYKKDKLSKEKIKLLNDLDIEWCVTDTKLLNKTIDNYNEYNKILLKRMKNVLEELIYEEKNEINSLDKQKEIEKVIIKRIFR